MSAGQPNWTKLAEMGKLPVSARNRVQYLSQIDVLTERVKKLEEENKLLRENGGVDPQKLPEGDGPAQIKCEFPGCPAMMGGKSEAVARNNLRLHMRSHETKVSEV